MTKLNLGLPALVKWVRLVLVNKHTKFEANIFDGYWEMDLNEKVNQQQKV